MLDKTIISAYKQLNLEVVPEGEKEQITELGNLVQKFFNAGVTRKQAKKIEDQQKKGILLRLEVGDELELDDVGLKVKVSTRDTVDMDQAKLEYLVKQATLKHPQLGDLLEYETITQLVIDDDKLYDYVDKGYIRLEDIASCITTKSSKMVTVKALKKSNKKTGGNKSGKN